MMNEARTSCTEENRPNKHLLHSHGPCEPLRPVNALHFYLSFHTNLRCRPTAALPVFSRVYCLPSFPATQSWSIWCHPFWRRGWKVWGIFALSSPPLCSAFVLFSGLVTHFVFSFSRRSVLSCNTSSRRPAAFTVHAALAHRADEKTRHTWNQ